MTLQLDDLIRLQAVADALDLSVPIFMSPEGRLVLDWPGDPRHHRSLRAAMMELHVVAAAPDSNCGLESRVRELERQVEHLTSLLESR